MIGMRKAIAAETAGKDYIASPCLLAQMDVGNTTSIPMDMTTNEPVYSSLTNIEIFFNGGYSNAVEIAKTGAISIPFKHTDPTPISIAAWLQFVAAFFNREGSILNVVPSLISRYNCNKDAITEFSLPPKNLDTPIVMWAYYADYTSPPSWNVGTVGILFFSFFFF